MHRKAAPTPTDASRWQAFDALATLVVVTDSQGLIAHANAALEDHLGCARRSLVGKPLAQIVLETDDLARAQQALRNEQASAMRFDAHLHAPDLEPMAVHLILAATHQDGELIAECIPLDTQIRQERENRWRDQAAANKELIRNLAHEIKNPLGGIRGAAQLLEMELTSRDQMEYTQVIVREADRLQTLVDRLLAPHRRARQLQQVNIHEVLERVRSLILAEFPTGLRLVRDYDTSLPEFTGDLEQLIQAVLNIAHNAAQALVLEREQNRGVIRLRTRVARQINIGSQRHRLALELHVIDNGPGIPPELQDRLFYPLVSGRDGGSGLGLHLAQTFVQQHQGLIEFESAPGCTDFKLLIPIG
jgi:two-component system nitrogen regulation sensor histidine kinase GlnL